MIQIICIAIVTIVSLVLLFVLEHFFRELREYQEQVETLRMLLLKCVITDKELSRQARLDAYDEYKKEGGNSWVDAYVVKHLKSIED